MLNDKMTWYLILSYLRLFGLGADSQIGFDDILDLDVDVETERKRVLQGGDSSAGREQKKDVLQVENFIFVALLHQNLIPYCCIDTIGEPGKREHKGKAPYSMHELKIF